MKKIILSLSLLIIGLFFASASVAYAWPWSTTYTVNTSVWPGYSVGALAWVTLYGNNGYYGHKQTDSNLGGPHLVSFYNVPGGSNVYNRIDVDLQDGLHREYYSQHIYNAWVHGEEASVLHIIRSSMQL